MCSLLEMFPHLFKKAINCFMGDSVVRVKKNKCKGILNTLPALVPFPSVFKGKKKAVN